MIMKIQILVLAMAIMTSFSMTIQAQNMKLAKKPSNTKALYQAAKTADQDMRQMNRKVSSMKTSKARKAKIRKVIGEAQGLMKKIAATQGRMSKTQYQKFQRQIGQIEQKLAAPGLVNKGIGGCMVECADSFPGVGGGNGVNRVLCKAACLVHGG